MNRLQSELHRLFGGEGRERALVLELVAPAGWNEVAQVWRGVQADLDLPAPAIAIDGVDAYQLWFPLAQPAPAGHGERFLAGLRRRYLAGVAPERIRLPASPAAPPAQKGAEHWSAFLAPDLAPLFADERWIDQPPGADAQADLLSRVQVARPEAFARGLAQLEAAEAPQAATSPSLAAPTTGADPRAFLLSVMQDAGVDLRLRIDAAKALLAAGAGARR